MVLLEGLAIYEPHDNTEVDLVQLIQDSLKIYLDGPFGGLSEILELDPQRGGHLYGPFGGLNTEINYPN